MTGPVTWKVLSAGAGAAPVVLAVDFDTTGRPEARFTDLVANLKTDLAFRETIPPPARPGSALTAADYLDHWAAPLEAERPQVRAVLGYCAGAVYAAALAERIEQWQGGQVPLLLFDPEVTVAQTLLWQFYKIVGFMSAMASPGEIEAANQAAGRVYESDPRIGPLRDNLMTLARGIGEPAFARAGLGKGRVDELFGAFDSFMAFLAAAGEIDPFDRWRGATAISSTSPTSGLNGIRAAGVGADQVSVAREITFDTEHATMLADKDIAATVSDLLNG